ncbi:tyrosine-type recombinase/integrase [Spartinivicinus ruber]|uniref:tyrosine-type recombinase/integrase n=1 Tax=Spartinivicinus ruber TaxID=2683272 RepID=UPI0013D2B73F|nr:site-specific integrase [Spartinivicinus ruber]
MLDVILHAPKVVTPEELQKKANRVDGLSESALGASNDIAAVQTFLVEVGGSSEHTLRRYRRECLRFLAWVHRYLNKQLNGLKREDILAYRYFLQAPTSVWQQAGLMIPELPQFIPFPNALVNGNSVDSVMKVVGSLLSYLHAQGYIKINPAFRLKPLGENTALGHQQLKAFNREEWQFLIDGIRRLPIATTGQRNFVERARYIVAIAYGTGIREHELATHTHQAIVRTDLGYELNVLGKGARRRWIPLNEGVIEAIIRFRHYHGLDPTINNDAFPFASSRKPVKKQGEFAKNISTRQLRDFHRQLLYKLIDQAGADISVDFKENLLSKGFHSYRHTAITHLANQPNVMIERVRLFAGHQDINTTKLYILTERDELLAYIQRHYIQW